MSKVVKLVDRRVEQVAAATSPLRIGLVQVNNSFSGQNYLPYSIACLRSYIEAHARSAARFEPPAEWPAAGIRIVQTDRDDWRVALRAIAAELSSPVD